MCNTYNTIGSLTTLKSHLENHNIYDFKSLKEVMEFQASYASSRQRIILQHKNLIEQEKSALSSDLKNLELAIASQKQNTEQQLKDEIENLKKQLNNLRSSISTNFIQKLYSSFKKWNLKRQINQLEETFIISVSESTSDLTRVLQVKNKRYQFIHSNIDEAIKQSAAKQLSEHDRKKDVIDSLNNYIYGAIGENKVVKTLENLSDDYFLINDFSVSFSPAIYNKQENDYIKSIQVDHILVAPSGIFLIETKNWSEKSVENLNLRSPVQQTKRTSFALFRLLNHKRSNYHLKLDGHHWGDKKISIRNLIVLTNTKPKEDFQFVKILTLDELLSYINYFKPVYSSDETQRIAYFLLSINSQKHINTR